MCTASSAPNCKQCCTPGRLRLLRWHASARLMLPPACSFRPAGAWAGSAAPQPTAKHQCSAASLPGGQHQLPTSSQHQHPATRKQPASSAPATRPPHAAAPKQRASHPYPASNRTCQAAATCSTTNRLAAAITPVGSLMFSSTSAGRGKRLERLMSQARELGTEAAACRCRQFQLAPKAAVVYRPAWQVSATCTTPLRCLHLPRTLHAAPALPCSHLS